MGDIDFYYSEMDIAEENLPKRCTQYCLDFLNDPEYCPSGLLGSAMSVYKNYKEAKISEVDHSIVCDDL